MKLRIPLAVLLLGFALAGAVRAADPALAAVKVDEKAHTIDFLAGKELVARYHYGPDVAKPYFWPVNAPNGKPLTRGWPMTEAPEGGSKDHVHQKSAWFCHGDVIPEGLELKPTEKVKGVEGVDFWSENPGHGIIACTKVSQKEPRQIITSNEWRTAEGRKVLDETRIIRLHVLGDARLIVLDIDLHASAGPVTFGDTKEGSMGIRINDAIREEIDVDKKKAKGPGQIENAEGKVGEKALWGLASAWCDYSGPLDGQVVGLAILSDPKNPPASWHSRGYGLMAANPFGREKSGFPAMKGKTDLVKLAKGEHLKLRYGLLIHPGDARSGKVAELYQQFTKLP